MIAGSDRRGTAFGVFELSEADRRLAVGLVGGRVAAAAARRSSWRPDVSRRGRRR